MHDVEHMLESVLCLLGWLRECAKKLLLDDCVWLQQDQVVTVWVLIKSIAQEVSRARVECCLHTEQSDGERVLQ